MFPSKGLLGGLSIEDIRGFENVLVGLIYRTRVGKSIDNPSDIKVSTTYSSTTDTFYIEIILPVKALNGEELHELLRELELFGFPRKSLWFTTTLVGNLRIFVAVDKEKMKRLISKYVARLPT